jgi:hypothetical protein
MTHQMSSQHSKLDKAMNPEQFEQLVEAIVDGKYSWACVLILRFAGYNPLHYIPYRTYNRLMKERCQSGRQNTYPTDNAPTDHQYPQSHQSTSTSCLSNISDLGYLEVISERQNQVRGGNLEQWLNENLQEYNFIKFDLT